MWTRDTEETVLHLVLKKSHKVNLNMEFCFVFVMNLYQSIDSKIPPFYFIDIPKIFITKVALAGLGRDDGEQEDR